MALLDPPQPRPRGQRLPRPQPLRPPLRRHRHGVDFLHAGAAHLHCPQVVAVLVELGDEPVVQAHVREGRRASADGGPGPYTFILKATSEVPKRLMHAKRKTIGLRVPDNNITLALLDGLNEPMMSVTMMLPGEEYPMTDPYDIRQTLEHDLDLVIDGGFCGMEPTSVIDLVEDTPVIIRRGQGDVSHFEV